MRRPLFWVSLGLLFVALLHFLMTDVFPGAAERMAAQGKLKNVTLTGKVCGKEKTKQQEYFLIQINSNDSKAASSQQIISLLKEKNTDKIQCFLAVDVCESMPETGSLVRITGDFQFFQRATNPGEMDYERYYRSRGIGGKMTEAVIEKEEKKFLSAGELLYRLREFLADRLDRAFPEKEAGVMKTMLLGDRSDLDAELKELYQEGGIIHILSISGLHISLLGMGLYRLLRRLGAPEGAATVCCSLVLLLYAVMTGLSVSACRAAEMFLLKMLAVRWGRTYDILTALTFLGACMVCVSPRCFLQSGFWLSYGSVAGVVCVLPVIRDFLTGEEREVRGGWASVLAGRLWTGIREGLKGGLAILLMTLPLQLWFFYETPVFSMGINLLVLPCMGAVVVLGILAMLLPGAGLPAILDVLLLGSFEKVCELVRELPGAVWNPGCPELWQVVIYYLLLGGVLWTAVSISGWYQKKRWGIPVGFRERLWGEGYVRIGWQEKLCGLLLRLGLLCIPVLVFLIPVHKSGVIFLDVGQGDGICIRQGGHVWICDCGSTDKKNVGEKVLLPFLKHEGIHHIDGIFLTHDDQDHCSGVLELLEMASEEGIVIDRIYLPTGWVWEEGSALAAVTGTAGKKTMTELAGAVGEKTGITVSGAAGMETLPATVFLRTGDLLKGDGISFEVLHPDSTQKNSWDNNERSFCLLVRIQNGKREMSLLLTGDVEGKGEKALIEQLKKEGIWQVDLLKCAHHGSKNATGESFLEQIDMQAAVISCGRNNRYGHPHEELMQRLAEEECVVLRTDLQGAVEVRLRGGKMRVKCWGE